SADTCRRGSSGSKSTRRSSGRWAGRRGSAHCPRSRCTAPRRTAGRGWRPPRPPGAGKAAPLFPTAPPPGGPSAPRPCGGRRGGGGGGKGGGGRGGRVSVADLGHVTRAGRGAALGPPRGQHVGRARGRAAAADLLRIARTRARSAPRAAIEEFVRGARRAQAA